MGEPKKFDHKGDPLPGYVFKVNLTIPGGNAVAFFKSVGGLSYETEPVELKEGGVNHMTHKLVGGTKFKNLTFKRGFTADSGMLEWKNKWMKWQETGSDFPGRIASGTIEQLNNALDIVATWTFVNGFPAKWELSELDASKNEIAIETMEIAHHGLTYAKK